MFRNCADIGISESKSSASAKSTSKGSDRQPSDSPSSYDDSSSAFGSPSGYQLTQGSRQSVFIDQYSGLGGPSPSSLGGPSPFIQFSSKRSPSFSKIQVPFQQQIVSSDSFSAGFNQPQQRQQPSAGFVDFGVSHSAPQEFTLNNIQHQQFQQQPQHQQQQNQHQQNQHQQQQHQQQQHQQQQQQQRFQSQQPQPILQSFQSDFSFNNPSSSFSANQQVQNSRPQFQNVHQQPTPVAFSPSHVAPSPQIFDPQQLVSFSQSQPFSSPTNFGSPFSGQQSTQFQRSSNSAPTHENRGLSGFGGTGSESAFQTRRNTVFPVDQPQVHGGFGSSLNFG